MSPIAVPGWDGDALAGATGRGVRVGVIDSGWDRAQPEPRVRPGIAILRLDGPGGARRAGDDGDRFGHGTACADLVLRVAPDAEVVPVRVFNDALETSPGVLAAAIRWSVDAGLQVLNLSLGTCDPAGLPALYAACEYARRRRVVVVAAAHAEHGASAPAVFDNVLSVGALAGNNRFRVVYRPGEAVECLAHAIHTDVRWLGGERVLVAGTSYAAPIVTGAVARMRELHPEADLAAVRALLARHWPSPAHADSHPLAQAACERV
ncbi:MAG: S8 family serine peptidase [Gemmatimonadetes bacterium]|nr:S8 family serine peptidase [Gemmatimonadota bacterium]